MKRIGSGKLWSFETGGPVLSSAAIDARGAVYFGSFYGDSVHSLDGQGSELWTLDLPGGQAHVYSSPALGADGVLVFGALDGSVRSLQAP